VILIENAQNAGCRLSDVIPASGGCVSSACRPVWLMPSNIQTSKNEFRYFSSFKPAFNQIIIHEAPIEIDVAAKGSIYRVNP
jgi:hypothetical protein